VLFELRDVSFSRGGRRALDSIDAAIPAGAAVIVGPSGSGKSTLLRLLNRLADPERGTISYRRRPLVDYDPLKLRREVALVPQLPALLEGTVGSNLRYAAELAATELDAERCLRLAGLDADFEGRDVSRLSVGERQRAMLARALAQEPRVLLLDEPTAGINPTLINGLIDRLKRANAEFGITLFVIEHNMRVIMNLASHIYCMSRGELLAEGPPARIQDDQRVIDAYLGAH